MPPVKEWGYEYDAMSREHFDVLIVGGGPSGGAAARTLAAAARTVCLIDKATFPREKLCGGLITLRRKRIFEDIFESSWNDEIFNSSTDISFFSNGRFLANVAGYSRLFFTMRYDFDNYLLNLARAAGAHLKLGHTVSHFDLDRKLISLKSGLEISFDHLVGADGVNSSPKSYSDPHLTPTPLVSDWRLKYRDHIFLRNRTTSKSILARRNGDMAGYFPRATISQLALAVSTNLIQISDCDLINI